MRWMNDNVLLEWKQLEIVGINDNVAFDLIWCGMCLES